MLVDNGFLNTPRSVKEILDGTKIEGYNYSLKDIDNSLRNVFVKNEILQRIPKDKVWKYVIRK